MNWDNLISIVSIALSSGALAGLAYYKPRRRMENARAEDAEIKNRNNMYESLEKRLADRDTKVDILYSELRKEQAAHLETLHKLHTEQLLSKDLEYDKCKRTMCRRRIPPRKDEEPFFEKNTPES